MGQQARPARSNRALDIWLKAEHLSREERIERLAADADLIADLRADDFDGDDWAFFANELARYGLAVIQGWMRRGLMASKCAEKRIAVPTLPRPVQHDEAAITAIAGETVAEALDRFRDEVLIPGKWDPCKGASLRTYFIGQCMMRYANVLRRWMNNDMSWDNADLLDEYEVLTAGRLRGVEDDAIRAVTARLVLQGASSERAARGTSARRVPLHERGDRSRARHDRGRRQRPAQARTGSHPTTRWTKSEEGNRMSKIQRKVAKSSLGTKAATAARASVSRSQASRVVNRAAQIRVEKSSVKRDPK